jgi:hypothetical protein
VIARCFHDFLRSAAIVVEVIEFRSLKPLAGIGLLAVVLLLCRHTDIAPFDVKKCRAWGRSKGSEEIERGWREAALIGTAQRVEQNEMAGYRTGLGCERPSAEVDIIFFSL